MFQDGITKHSRGPDDVEEVLLCDPAVARHADYQYTAVDDLGQKQRGQMEAASESALEALLRKQGHWLPRRANAAPERPPVRARGNRPRHARVIEFFLQTGLQFANRIALVDPWASDWNNQTNVGFRAVQRELLERVRAGSSFSEALAATPHVCAAGDQASCAPENRRAAHRNLRRNPPRNYEWLDR